MKKTLLTKTLLLLFALIAGSTSSWAADVLHYTLDGTVTSGGNSNYAEDGGGLTQNDMDWSVIGNTTIAPWRIGGKNITNENRVAYSKTAMGAAITKVELEIGDINLEAVNSIKLIVASDEDFTSTIAELTKTEITANTTLTFAPTLPATEWATGAYYKFVFNVTQSTNSNKYLQFKSAKFYKSGAAVSVTGVTVDPTEWEMEVGETKALTATVAPAEATNKAVTWSSDKESVATVDEDGVVTAVAAGTANITVTTTDGSKTATCAITVNAPAPVSATIDFTTNSWGISEAPTKTVDATEFTSGDYTITLTGSSGNGYYFDTDNIMLGKKGATLTLPAFGFNVSKIKVYGTDGASASVTFNIFVGENAVSTAATSSQVDHEFTIAADKQDVGTVYVIKVTNANNMRISKIEIFGYLTTPAVTAAGWASYVTPKAVRFAEGEAFAVTAAGSGVVTLAEVTDVPNNFPVLLKGEGAKTALVLETSPAAPTNKLSISNGGSVEGYVLAEPAGNPVGFYKWAGGSLTSGKVYLPASVVAGAPDFLGFGGDATGINAVNGSELKVNGEYYNLAGQRVAQPTKGLYIVNGKKVVMK